MFCKKCGHEVKDSAKFCPGCGTSIERTAPAPVPTPIPEAPAMLAAPDTAAKPEEMAAPAKKKGGLIAVISLLAVLAVGAGGCFLFRDKLFGGGEEEIPEALMQANVDAEELHEAARTVIDQLSEEGCQIEDGCYIFTESYEKPEEAPALPEGGSVSVSDPEYLLWQLDEEYDNIEELEGFGFYVEDNAIVSAVVENEEYVGAYPNPVLPENAEDMQLDEAALEYAADVEPSQEETAAETETVAAETTTTEETTTATTTATTETTTETTTATTETTTETVNVEEMITAVIAQEDVWGEYVADDYYNFQKVWFQDIDLDGVNELIAGGYGGGSNHEDYYYVYQYAEGVWEYRMCFAGILPESITDLMQLCYDAENESYVYLNFYVSRVSTGWYSEELNAYDGFECINIVSASLVDEELEAINPEYTSLWFNGNDEEITEEEYNVLYNAYVANLYAVDVTILPIEMSDYIEMSDTEKQDALNASYGTFAIGEVLEQLEEKTAEETAEGIPANAVEYNGSYYCLYEPENGVTWKEANEACQQNGGHLVTITSQEEQDFITSLLADAGQNCYWTGGYYSQGQWCWLTEEAFSFANWAENEPNNQEEAEAYIHLFGKEWSGGTGMKYVGDWNDSSNDGAAYAHDFYDISKFGYICEWN